MKHTCVAAALVFLISCKQAPETSNQTAADTSASTSAGTTTTTAPAETQVSVDFTGLVAHVLGPYQKAVIINAPDHDRTVRIAGVSKGANDVVKQIGGECIPDCTFKVNYMSMQLLDGQGKALTGDLTNSDKTFVTLVPDLGDLAASAYEEANLTPEAKGEVKEGSKISWGTFDLHGGDAHSDPMPCQGRIMTGSRTVRPFPKVTTVKFKVAGPAVLRITDAMKKTYDVPLEGPMVAIKIENNEPGSHESDFDQYAKLSTAKFTLPKIEIDKPEQCMKSNVGEQNGIPGCHDTRVSLGTLK
jgi:hypothetical protein